jgi:hypothetical protein
VRGGIRMDGVFPLRDSLRDSTSWTRGGAGDGRLRIWPSAPGERLWFCMWGIGGAFRGLDVLGGLSTRRLRSTGASSVVGESVGTVWSLSAWIFWLHKDRSCGARLLPQALETALTPRGSLRGRGVCGLVNIGACGGRSVLRKGRSKSAADAKVRPCPYFRRGVTCGEMEGYVWREGGAKGWR